MAMIAKIKIFVFLFLSVSIWEHVATETTFQYKPTYFINILTECSREIFKQIGELYATLCSFLEHFKKLLELIKIDNYFKSVCRLFWSVSDLAMSWLWTIFGYVEHVQKLTTFSRELTIVGSIIITAVISVLFYVYVWRNNKLAFVRYIKKYLSKLQAFEAGGWSSFLVFVFVLFTCIYAFSYYLGTDVRNIVHSIYGI